MKLMSGAAWSRGVLEVEETRSTNDEARGLALEGAPEGTAVLAKRQTAGRGRAGRTFLSPEGGLYLSIVLRPRAPPHQWGILPLASGVAVIDELRARAVEATLKWPNDILSDRAKVGGILVESRMGETPFAVVGIGLNLSRAPDLPHVAGLEGAAGTPRSFAAGLVPRLVDVSRRLTAEGPAGLASAVRRVCVTLGREVEWDGKKGRARDVGDDGSLVVEGAAGLEHVVAGDVAVRFGSR